MDSPGEITRLLEAVRRGDDSARARLWDAVYGEMRRLAEASLRGERPGHSLQPTVLVHEAYLRLLGGDGLGDVPNRAYLFGAAAAAMRRILVDHARARRALKRGGRWERTALDDVLAAYESRQIDLLALDEAMETLKALSPRQHQVVEEYHFGGFAMREIAEHLGVSEATVSTDFSRAQRWLASRMGQDAP